MKAVGRGMILVGVVLLVVLGVYCLETGVLPSGSLWAYEEAPVEMVVLMYHSVDSNPGRSGPYTITPEALRADLQYLKSEGYETVLMSDIIGYVNDGTPLPEKPVMLTFDDGFYNNYINVLPLLEEFDMQAVISIIGEETDRFSAGGEKSEKYGSLTWEEIRAMAESGRVEFQNHSYGLHNMKGDRHGLAQKWGESSEEYKSSVTADLQKLQESFVAELGAAPTTFAYPFGVVTEEGDQVLRDMGFLATLDSRGKVFEVTHEEDCLWRIPRYNRGADTTAREIIEEALD